MRIDWATACRGIRSTERGIDLTGVQQQGGLAVGGFPFPVRIIVAVSLRFHYEELGTETVHQLRAKIYDPDLQVVLDKVVREFGLYPADIDFPPGWEAQGIEPADLRFVAQKEGTYTLELQLDDSDPITLPYLLRSIPEL